MTTVVPSVPVTPRMPLARDMHLPKLLKVKPELHVLQ